MLTQTIPSYLYVQYNDDENLQAFVDAFNELAQEYVTWFATVSLPVYTELETDLLSWVGEGLYGVPRPYIPDEVPRFIGPVNTFGPNVLPVNGWGYALNGSFSAASDDIYKRVLTWRLYKGDGHQFSVMWLKRRIARFLYGADGSDPPVEETYDISVQFVGGNVVWITVPGFTDTLLLAQMGYMIKTGVLELPFQYIFNVIT